MKKIFLLLSMITMIFATMARDTPYVVVHKSNGGHWAWLNLYNDILYTPSNGEGQPATLDCTGAGYSSCRVPRFNAYACTSIPEVLSAQAQNAIADAINMLIKESEELGARGTYSGQKSKTIAVSNTASRGYDTYFVKAVWNYGSDGEGTMYIYVNQSDLLNARR